MTETPLDNPYPQPQSDSETGNFNDLLQLLRRKESNWIEWGRSCQQLQKAGYNAQTIFEETGFEPIQQNQVIVASQVYETLVAVGISEAVRSRFERTGSDTLYELRILTQPQRAAASELIVAKNLDSDAAREVAKAMKEFFRRTSLPEGFTNHAGDAVAYQYWKLAKQQSDLQERARLIARGLMFVYSPEARQQIEQLLTEGFGSNRRPAPRLPFYRIELSEQLPRLLPILGKFPLTTDVLNQIPAIQPTGAFELIEISQKQTVITIPGWQVVLKAKEPVGILCNTHQISQKSTEKPEDVLVIIDRAGREWDDDSYFAIDKSGELGIEWFADQPSVPLLGRLILVLRPKKIIDEALSRDMWQIDE
ncbi:RuBisCO accumulation factor 1 [Limnofasciculus baicalensis]|uniref:RuBisCO accumulation factor 1 n=1 Tax=Limnofasciculus baicalensis BBK-W-15 TaxID=2699891 RepID=A0AAE3GVC3_9CYAN|nr:RuBisCO accumulation factor 1 [Limnofasciculus baicalensis]MCP2731134.1 hypothetical protein [Limnofasciculus baicalensis BBK-W-15]